MEIALVQAELCWEDNDKNLAHFSSLLETHIELTKKLRLHLEGTRIFYREYCSKRRAGN